MFVLFKITVFSLTFLLGSILLSSLEITKNFIKSKPPGRRLVIQYSTKLIILQRKAHPSMLCFYAVSCQLVDGASNEHVFRTINFALIYCSGYVRYPRTPGQLFAVSTNDIHDIKHDQSCLGLGLLLDHLRHHSIYRLQHGQGSKNSQFNILYFDKIFSLLGFHC